MVKDKTEELCGKCKKPKGEGEDFCNCGRPSEFKEEYIEKVDDYLEENQDEVEAVLESENERTGRVRYDPKLKVKLPTIEGFARYINVSKKSLYNWEKEHPKFLHALEKIKIEQQQRLINMGLSGDYNPTIAKLVLSANHNMREKADLTSDNKEIGSNLIDLIKYAHSEEEGD